MHAWHMRTRITNRGHRAALTLLELVVVLAILAVLAGIVIVKLDPNKGLDVAWATNLLELDKLIMERYGDKNAYPNGFDSLLDKDGNFYLGIPGTVIKDTQTEVLPLTTAQVTVLSNAGITTVQVMRSDPDYTKNLGATYFAYGNGLYTNPSVLVGGTSKAVFLKKNASGTYNFPPNKMRFNDDHVYVIFGVGQGCDLFTADRDGLAKDCPVLRHVEGCTDPEKAYCRALAIFDITVNGTRGNPTAKFVGTVAVGNQGFKYSSEIAEIPNRFK